MRLSFDEKLKRGSFVLSDKLLLLGEQKKFKKNQVLYNKGDEALGVYFVRSGFLGLVNIAKNGSETLLRVSRKNEFSGQRSFFSNENYHATCIALSDVEVLFFPFESPEACSQENPELFMHLVKCLAQDLRLAEERLNDFSGKKVSSRIIEGILFLKLKYPGHQWTRREIGEFCGAQTETVTRVLTKLENLGLIIKEGREILVPDQENLLAYADDRVID